MAIKIESLRGFGAAVSADIQARQLEGFPLIPTAPEDYFGKKQLGRFLAMDQMVSEVAPEIAREFGQKIVVDRDFSPASDRRRRQSMSYLLRLSDPLEEGQEYPRDYGFRGVTLRYNPGTERFFNAELLALEPTLVTAPEYGHYGEVSLGTARKAIEEGRSTDVSNRRIWYEEDFSKKPEATKEALSDMLRIGIAAPVRVFPRW